jgi:tetratricopeptide (TPR) repeat protein
MGIVTSNYLSLLGRPKPALAMLERVRPLLPEDDAEVRLAMAALNLRLGNRLRARDLLEQAHRLAPKRVDVGGMLAGMMEQAGEIDEAVRLLEACHQALPDNLSAANDLAWMLAVQGEDLDRALRLAKLTVDRQPSNAAALDTLGWIHHLRGDNEIAVRYLSQAVDHDARQSSYHYHLGTALRAAGREGEARESFARAVELAPTPRPSWFEEARAGSREP